MNKKKNIQTHTEFANRIAKVNTGHRCKTKYDNLSTSFLKRFLLRWFACHLRWAKPIHSQPNEYMQTNKWPVCDVERKKNKAKRSMSSVKKTLSKKYCAIYLTTNFRWHSKKIWAKIKIN